ncbi:unnamed protein product [Rhodiola kirilowii]
MESDSQFPQSSSSGKFRDPSFSSYLNGDADGDGQAVVKLDKLTLSRSYQNGRVSTDDEISVFSAYKYFNEEVAENNVNAVTHPVRSQISLGTPSTRSESSWHSQSALLHSTGEIQRKKSLLYRLSCRCSCASKKSINVDDNHGKSVASNESIRPGSSRADQLLKLSPNLPRKPWMKDGMKMLHPSAKPSLLNKAAVENNPSTKLQKCITNSFGLPAIVKIGKSKSHEKMGNILNWDDSYTRSEELYNPSVISVEYYTDAESDASSDLFEIDSFTGHRKQSFSDQVPDSSASGYATHTTG